MRDFFPFLAMDFDEKPMCREFQFRMNRSGETFLTIADIQWFCNQLEEKAVDEYIKEVEAPFFAFLQKYLIDNPDGRWSNYFYTKCKRFAPYELYFEGIACQALVSKTQRTFVVPKKTSRKARILIEKEDFEMIDSLRSRKDQLSKLINRIYKLNTELQKLLSKEDLFKAFPKAEELFNARVETEQTPMVDFGFVDELLES